MSKCQATTKAGEPCQNPAGEDGFCHVESHGPESGGSEDPVERPREWDRVLDAAAYLVLGETVARAAEMSGVGERTISRWRACSWWPEAKSEAVNERLDQVGRFALRTVRDAMRDGEDTRLAWDIVKALVDEAPDDTQNVDVTSDGEKLEGGRVEVVIQDSVVEPEGAGDAD